MLVSYLLFIFLFKKAQTPLFFSVQTSFVRDLGILNRSMADVSGRFKVAQIFAFSTGKTFPTTQHVLAELVNDNHTFHLRGPAIKDLNVLYTATR